MKKIEVELPQNWEKIDPNRMYHIITGFTFISDEVSQAEHDLICNICAVMGNLLDKPIKETYQKDGSI